MQQPSACRRFGNSRYRVWTLLIAPAIGLMLLLSRLQTPYSLFLERFLATNARYEWSSSGSDSSNANHENNDMRDDILVILKTGVTESLQKVPVHIETTLSKVPNYVVFSDYQETIAGITTYDVLSNVSERVKRNAPEFKLYNRIHAHGRHVLTETDHGDDSNGPFGRTNNPGWKLDKWKFIPMIDLALDLKPDAKWFVFMEADSYLVLPNLVEWLSRLDGHRDLYLGIPMRIGRTMFAYGGAGFVLSNSAMRKVSEYRAANARQVDDITATHWAGDCVLGKVLLNVGIGLSSSWPMLQTDTPWELNYFTRNGKEQTWCYPLVSYHHMTPDDIREMWKFEREWFELYDPSMRLLLYSDAFRRLVLPEIVSPRVQWDNLAEELVTTNNHGTSLTLDDCAQHCANDKQCLQYAYHPNRSCFTSRGVKRGVPKEGVRSNWMLDRIFLKIETYEQACAETVFM